MGVICIIGCFIHYFTTKERVQPEGDEDEHIGLIETFKALYSYKPFVMNTLYILLYGIVNLLLLTCLTYYCTYVMGSTSAVTMIQAAYLVCSLAMSFLVGPIDRRIGRKKTMLLGGVFYVVGKIWFVIDPYSLPALYVNATTTGIAVSITFIMFNTNRNNLSDLVAWREGRRMDGMIGTADNLASSLAKLIAAKLMTGALAASRWDHTLDVQPQSAIDAINAMVGIVPAVVGVLIVVVVLALHVDDDLKRLHGVRSPAARQKRKHLLLKSQRRYASCASPFLQRERYGVMKDLKHLIYFERLLDRANNELVQQAKADGKLALGYVLFRAGGTAQSSRLLRQPPESARHRQHRRRHILYVQQDMLLHAQYSGARHRGRV